MTNRTSTAAVLLALAASTALAQPKAVTGLDALDEGAVQSELASYGLDALLAYSFEVNKTPESSRTGVRTLAALRQLSDPNVKLTSKQRDDVVSQVVKGIEAALPGMKEPKLLMQQAGVLVTEAVGPDLNTLEYWGENPRLQATLRPITEAVQKIYDKATAEADAAAEKLAEQMGPNAPAAAEARWQAMDDLKMVASFNKAMSAYALARSIDKADPKRKQVADEAIAILQPFDATGTSVQPAARIRIAKLNLAKGDFATAKKIFDSVEAEAATLDPKPGLPERYEAKYFGAQALMLAGDVAGARKALADVQTWQKANLPKEQLPGADAAARMLEFRVASVEAEKANGPAKVTANDRSIAILLGIVKDYPQYRPIIFQQLFDRIPANADVTKLDPLLLSAMMQRGNAERAKGEGEKVDAKALEGAANAAVEMIARKGKGVDAATAEDATIQLPYYLLKLDRKPDAAAAFLTYVQAYPQGRHAKGAIENAGGIVFEMQAKDQSNPALAGLMDRFLPQAVEKFGYKELAYMYAARLRETDKFTEAVKYFRMVPDTDPNATKARYFEMLSLKQELDADDGKMGEAGRKAVVAQIQKLADAVNARAAAAEKAATRDADKAFYRFVPVRTALLAADLSKRSKDPTRTIQLLNGFETAVKGAPSEDSLTSEALFLRVGSYMDLGQTDKATENLVALLNTKGGEQGLRIVFDLLQRLDQDYNAALLKNDAEAQRVIAANRANLSGYLVTWAANNKDPKIKQFTYKYRVFDASSKQLAANLSTDPAARKSGLQAALKLYQDLQSPENIGLYKATLPPEADQNYGDPQVMMGLALVEFDLANYGASSPMLSRLLNDRKLGAPTMEISQNGVRTRVDNDQFWEATYKQLKGFVETGKAPNADDKAKAGLEAVKSRLKQQYIQFGKGVGGKKWAAAFETLRKEIIPDYKVQDLDSATQPTEPVAER